MRTRLLLLILLFAVVYLFLKVAGLSGASALSTKLDVLQGSGVDATGDSAENGEKMHETRTSTVIDGFRVAPGSLESAVPLPLPPKHARVAASYDDLVSRVNRGDATAARRLYDDISGCRFERAKDSPLEGNLFPIRAEFDGSEDAFQAALNRWKSQNLKRCVWQHRCAGATLKQLARPEDWLLRAAELGDIDAQVDFATGRIFDRPKSIDSYELLERWRQQAIPWMEHAVSEGNAVALLAYGTALATPRGQRYASVLSQLVPEDPVRGYSYIYALSISANLRSSPDVLAALASVEGQLSPEQRANGRRKGEDLYLGLRREIDNSTSVRSKPSGTGLLPEDESWLREQGSQCAKDTDMSVETALSVPFPDR